MLKLGSLLVSSGPLEKFPADIPLLVYHGGEDGICSPIASKEFVDKCNAKDKTYHEVKVGHLPLKPDQS